jgi:acyl transferase domain-containing protein
MFPGQGSQYAGMTKDLLSYKIVRDTLDEVDHSLQFKLSQIMLEGPENELTETHNAQPAIITHSIAVLRLLEVSQLLLSYCHCLTVADPSIQARTRLLVSFLRKIRDWTLCWRDFCLNCSWINAIY